MFLEIVTPESTLFKGTVSSVKAPGVHGIFQILSHHAPFLTTLTRGTIGIEPKGLGEVDLENLPNDFKKSNRGKVLNLEISSGVLETHNNKVSILIG